MNYKIFSVFLLSFTYGCVQPQPTESSTSGNQNPVIEEIVVNPPAIDIGKTADISIRASDPENDRLSYKWSTVIGDIIGNGADVRYTAAFCCVGVNRISVSVEDSRGGKTSSYADIIVNDTP